MSESPAVNATAVGAFKFWSKKDKEIKDIPDFKKNGLSKEFIWTFVLNNVTEFDETQCVQQLNEVRKVWAVVGSINESKEKKSHQRKTSTYTKDIVQMIEENYKFVTEERNHWEEAVGKMSVTVNQLNEENENLKEQIKNLKIEQQNNRSTSKREPSLSDIELQLKHIVMLNTQIDSKISEIANQKTNVTIGNNADDTIKIPTYGKGVNDSSTDGSKRININKGKGPITIMDKKKDSEDTLGYPYIDESATRVKTPELTHEYPNSLCTSQLETMKKSLLIDDYEQASGKEFDGGSPFLKSTKTKPIKIGQTEEDDDDDGFTIHRIEKQPTTFLNDSDEHASILLDEDLSHLGNTPYIQRKSAHFSSYSVSEGGFVRERLDSGTTTPYRLMKMPLKRYNSKHNELFISPSCRRSRSFLTPNSEMSLSFDNSSFSDKKPITTQLNQSNTILLTPRSKQQHDFKEKEEELKLREENLKKREEELSQKEKGVLVVQIETENREEELQAWEEDIQRRENEIGEREGEVRRREIEIERKEEESNKKEMEQKQREIERIESTPPEPIKVRASEPPKEITSREVEELKKEKMQLEQTLQDQQLRVWTLEEQNKRVERIVRMMDAADPSEEDVNHFIETIKEIVNRKKQKLRFLLTQKLVETFSRYVQQASLSTSMIITPRGTLKKSEKKKDKKELVYVPFIPNKLEGRRKTSFVSKDNFDTYRNICQDFYVKEGEYYRILNEFYDVYIKNINWSSMKDFFTQLKDSFEPILLLTKKIVDELDRAYSDPLKDSEGKSCIALGSIMEKYSQTLRVYLNYILKCPYFIDNFPVFSRSKELTDSLIRSITNYVNTQKLNDPSFVFTSLLPLSAYILAPASHISSYAQLMRDLAMNVSRNHFDCNAIQNALKIIETIEEEIDVQKNSTERKEAARFVQTIFTKSPKLQDGKCELVYFGFLRPVDAEKCKVHEENIRICFLFTNIFFITRIKTFQGKVLDKKSLLSKYYQEISGIDVGNLKDFIIEEVDRCFVGDHLIVSFIQNFDYVINGFAIEFNERQYNFVASSQKEQRNWCNAFSSLM